MVPCRRIRISRYRNATLENSTTTWTCSLQGCPGCRHDTGSGVYANCTNTIISGGSATTATKSINSCFLAENYVPVVVTAGAEKLMGVVADVSPNFILNSVDSVLSSYNCPLRATMTADNAPSAQKTSLMASPGQTTGANVPSNTSPGSAKPTTSTSESWSWRQTGEIHWEKKYLRTLSLILFFFPLGEIYS
jgi:hypothetical protein